MVLLRLMKVRSALKRSLENARRLSSLREGESGGQAEPVSRGMCALHMGGRLLA